VPEMRSRLVATEDKMERKLEEQVAISASQCLVNVCTGNNKATQGRVWERVFPILITTMVTAPLEKDSLLDIACGVLQTCTVHSPERLNELRMGRGIKVVAV